MCQKNFAANIANRRFLGIDQEETFLSISKNRKIEIENTIILNNYKQRLNGFNNNKELELILKEEPSEKYSKELIF